MSVHDLEQSAGPNGHAILNEFKNLEKEFPKMIKLKDTARGLSVCVRAGEMEIELVQMAGATNDETAHTLESRQQWITKCIYLNNGERNRLAFLLQRAKFKPINGGYGNFRLKFEEGKDTVAFDKEELSRLRETVLEMAKLVQLAKR